MCYRCFVQALSFAEASPAAFVDLFNACVDEQADQLDRTPMQRSARTEFNTSGAARVTVFSGVKCACLQLYA